MSNLIFVSLRTSFSLNLFSIVYLCRRSVFVSAHIVCRLKGARRSHRYDFSMTHDAIDQKIIHETNANNPLEVYSRRRSFSIHTKNVSICLFMKGSHCAVCMHSVAASLWCAPRIEREANRWSNHLFVDSRDANIYDVRLSLDII